MHLVTNLVFTDRPDQLGQQLLIRLILMPVLTKIGLIHIHPTSPDHVQTVNAWTTELDEHFYKIQIYQVGQIKNLHKNDGVKFSAVTTWCEWSMDEANLNLR